MIKSLCPHWWTEDPHAPRDAIMFDVISCKKCLLCGKRRIHARVPEPHPTRDKGEVVADLQRPEHEFVVEEWLPYGSKMPDLEGSE